MQREANKAAENQMKRIIDVEEPEHPFPEPAFAIIQFQQRDRQRDEQLNDAVKRVDKDYVNKRVNACQIIMRVIYILKSPRCAPISMMPKTAMLLQSAIKATIVQPIIISIFCQSLNDTCC